MTRRKALHQSLCMMKPMQGELTLYDTLEVSPRACPQVIRAAYRCLAQFNHPDKKAGSNAASERLAQINYAYAILSDPEKRDRYDQTIKLQERFNERRGVDAPAQGGPGTSGTTPQAERPFVFRPLT